tara:strand:- start:529 stop:720 length:192 start_codon:yes stop_codon:yes gene_type:complete
MAAGIAMAEAVETMVGQAAASVLADEMMCPALREFGVPAQGRQADTRSHGTSSPQLAACSRFP